ncbi:fimbria/pilus outer membrane usher protein [Lonsdalea quercina]|uniref:fimbria/pilus outer membrane usher protein n=1 Tax=Lonsdalea quercina TaxID=71657 RepID=UPI003975D0B6
MNGTLLRDNNLNYSVMQRYGSQDIGNSSSANLNYQGTYGNSNIGYNYSRDSRQVHYGLNGQVNRGREARRHQSCHPKHLDSVQQNRRAG